MHTIAASEIKRRGVIVLEESLKKGHVHIIKNNRPICAVLSEKDYEKILNILERCQAQPKSLTLASLLKKPSTGNKTRKKIDQILKTERSSWE